MKKIQLLTFLLALSTFAFAQTPYNMQWGSYSQNFNSLGTMSTGNTAFPAGWGLYETDNNADNEYRASTGSSTAGDTYSFGAANSTERSLGGLLSGSLSPSYGFGFTNNTGFAVTSMDISATMEQWRASNSTAIDSCYFYYSTNASGIDDTSATWVSLSALDMYSAVNPTSTSALDGNLAANQVALNGSITLAIPMNATVYFKWVDLNITGSDDGLSIDDVSITLYDASGPLPAGPPVATGTTPADNATNVPLSTTSLSITLDQPITALGSGSVTLTDITNSSNITLTGISNSGNTATFSGVTLASNTDYAVQIDSGLLVTANGAFYGITGNTTWNFKTENTTPPPAVTTLDESFLNCADPVFGVFSAYSEEGGQDWRCTTFGHNDSNAVRMNGFSSGPKDNVDWLISPPLDFSAMLLPNLDFWSKLRFPDANAKELLISTDYSGIGSPTAANWQALQVNNWAGLDTTWKPFTNTDLTPYKSTIFHIAFRYTSDTTMADEWSLDDIRVIDKSLSATTFSTNEFRALVVGDVLGTLNLQSSSSADRKLAYTLYDMSGRMLNQGDLNILNGTQRHQINTASLQAGMYFIRLNDQDAQTTLKFIVQ